MQDPAAATFDYPLHRRSASFLPGMCPGQLNGDGSEFRCTAPLTDHPDARRIDAAQTLRDLTGQLHVRLHRQNTRSELAVLADLSASMQFRGRAAKTALVAEIAASVGASAHARGDAFAFFAFDDRVREEWTLRGDASLQEVLVTLRHLHGFASGRAGAQGLLEAAGRLGRATSLVFLVSDFHLPLATLEQALNLLARQRVVPLVIWDAREYLDLPRFGLLTLRDPETLEQRVLFFREALRRRFRESFVARRAALQALFDKYQSPPLFVENGFRAEMLSAYFRRYALP